MTQISLHAHACIHCGNCTNHCEFLKLHDIDLYHLEMTHSHLHGSCLVCGKCREVCPHDIDGNAITYQIRQRLYKKGQLDLKPYKMTLLEKKPYLFRNYRLAHHEKVFFPGCNFASFFPVATEKIAKLLHTKLNAGVVFECCSKPIYEIGMTDQALSLVAEMEERLCHMGVKEIITACPNCYYFLSSHCRSLSVSSIYESLGAMGIMKHEFQSPLPVFLPCPDRVEQKIFHAVSKLIPKNTIIYPIDEIQCCGLGGLAACVDDTVPNQLIKRLKRSDHPHIYTYCATCYGQFKRNGIHHVSHFLLEILDLHEPFPKGGRSVLNRAKFKYKGKL